MKMIYGGTPVKSLKVKHYEMDTNSATVQPSDMQAGVTCFARGQRVTGTGKSFEFAYYGQIESNDEQFIPTDTINVIQISSLIYPVKFTAALHNMKALDFSVGQVVGSVVIDSIDYPLTIISNNNTLVIECGQTIPLEVFYGKDNYV